MIIINDTGFLPEAEAHCEPEAILLAEALQQTAADRLPSTALIVDVAVPLANFEHLIGAFGLIIVPFAGFGDGRGFSIATELRRAGYTGRLRASGHLIPDQYAHARRCGFDEVAITREQARRQPEAHWLAEVAKIGRTYQNRLRQAAHAA